MQPRPFATPLFILLALLTFSGTTHAQDDDEDAPRSIDRPRPRRRRVEEEHLRIGAIGSMGFPEPLSVEGIVKLERVFALGVEYGFLPRTTVAGVEIASDAIAADARIFPFGDGFFMGIRAGKQHVRASSAVTLGSYGSTAGSIALDTWFVNPRIGFLWTSSPGLTIGLDMGVQIPVSATYASTFPSGVETPAQSAARAFGRSILPTVDLLRLGFLL